MIDAGRLVSIQLTSNDLSRHAATYASRSGTPIEIVSKVILRLANLATTQRYVGKITDIEAVRWMEKGDLFLGAPESSLGCDIDNKEAGIWNAIFWTPIAGYYVQSQSLFIGFRLLQQLRY